ncbi:hypothetical protein LMH73_012250 [Vibrio splendidus]|nr:hypothetical protein [Vibrio splendidus]MCC4880419.1 hypothetical protein [Vibrio splendidus]
MNKLKKGFFKVAGLTITITSFTMLGLSWYLYANPGVTTDSVKASDFAFKQCKEFSDDYDYTVSKEKYGTIKFIKKDIGNWEEHLATSSIIIERCKGYTLNDYCLGESCVPYGQSDTISGITFSLLGTSKIIVK